LFDLSREINRGRDRGREIWPAQQTLRELAGVLGLTLAAPALSVPQDRAPFVALIVEIRGKAGLPEEGPDASDAIEALLEMRREYRASKQWEFADRVRDGLLALGVELKDGPGGTTWRSQ
ncbi:MAG: hypothetical protein ABIP13_00985, partial [Tepidiformaceae bacterium]